jgi:ornithine carrier protein
MELQQSLGTAGESGGRLPKHTTVEDVRDRVVHDNGQGEEALKDVVCGSIAGVIGKYIEYPFDTVKVRLQSQPHHLPLLYTGPLDCFKKSYRQDGIRGIYRGISAPLVGAAVETSCLFFSVSILVCSNTIRRTQTHVVYSTVLPETPCDGPASILT